MGLFDSTDLADPLPAVLVAIAEERGRQDAKWGGADHDDGHNLYDWCEYISERVGRIRPGDVSDAGLDNARRRLVQAAALATAAVESIDRNRQRREELHAG